MAQYEDGCFGAAWKDQKKSGGDVSKSALMALISFVPILNFVCAGYWARWGAALLKGDDGPLPDRIVTGENFKNGFFIVLLNIIFYLIWGIESAILSIIPVLGPIASAVLGVFAAPFAVIAQMRFMVTGRFGEAFKVGAIMNAYKRNVGKAVGSVFCALAATFGCELLVGLVLVIALVVAGAPVMGMASTATRAGANAVMPSIYTYSAVVIIIELVDLYVGLVIAFLFSLAGVRTVAHYLLRYAPDWLGDVAGMPGNTPVAQQAAAPVAPVVPVAAQSAHPAQPINEAPVNQAAVPAQKAPAVVAEVAASATVAAAAPLSSESAARVARQTPDSYAFDETSVLPEMPEDLDTIVQPEQAAGHAVSESMFDPSLLHSASSEGRAPETGGAVRLQPTVASGPLMGDDSDTLVLMGGVSAKPEPAPRIAGGQRMLQLTRANGDTCVLSSYPVVIGKGSEADLVIDGNGAISRAHARILRDGDMFAAEDLGSTNKTFIGAYELPPNTPTILSDGDVLKLANESLQVKIV